MTQPTPPPHARVPNVPYGLYQTINKDGSRTVISLPTKAGDNLVSNPDSTYERVGDIDPILASQAQASRSTPRKGCSGCGGPKIPHISKTLKWMGLRWIANKSNPPRPIRWWWRLKGKTCKGWHYDLCGCLWRPKLYWYLFQQARKSVKRWTDPLSEPTMKNIKP